MCRPLLSITARHLLLHERIHVLHSSTDIFTHSPFKLVHKYSTFYGFFSLAISLSNFQTFSIGFMSGLWAGHSIKVTPSPERNILTDLAVWHGALSCINTAGWLIAVLKLSTFLRYIFIYSSINFTVLPDKRSCTSNRNHTKRHHTSSPKFNAAFSALRRIWFFRTASNEPSPIIT